MKTVWAAYGFASIVILAGIWAYFEYEPNWPAWVPAILLIVLLPPARMHLSRRLITLRLHDDHLTIERGFLSRTRRTVDIVKIQDVTVKQTLGQRLLGVGDLWFESAGERSTMGITNVDSPRDIADEIIASSKRSPSGGTRAGL